ncbi:MAG: hypothetical protein Unbinned3325contig1000_36 [Prokaryotic dsDNA virus sp.]|nr:MAG: hypothetical protein Unbinned3325contig1000_36 [Prokaryotic dsDNA virus sp.]|tara:strand:+ start:1270 stop:2310 length:1041 start_codon:yes stop_codon:yes gene_type:complete
MAINASFFTSKELTVGVGLDASNVGQPFAGTFTQIETDSVTFPTFNDIKVERRGGASSGIMTATTDMFHYGKGATIEGSVSGFLTDELMDILMPNVLGVAESSNSYTVDGTSTSNFTFEHNDGSVLTKTLTFAYNGVGSSTDDCVKIAGCVVTNLTITADPNEDGGRLKFEASFMSRTPMAIGSTYATSGATMGAYSANYIFLSDYSVHTQIGDADVLLKSLSLSIENPVVFGGFGGNGTDGAPQTYIRSIPEMIITANPVVKYDANVAGLWEKLRGSGDGVQSETLTSPAFEMADNATPASGSKAISITDGTVTEIAWDEGDYLGVSIGIKARGDSSTSFYVKNA